MKTNILQATLNVSNLCCDEIDKIKYRYTLVDGNHFPVYFSSKQISIIKI